MERHNVTVVDFKKPGRKKSVAKIILFSVLGLLLAGVIFGITVFVSLPSLRDDAINKYVELPGKAISFAEILSDVPYDTQGKLPEELVDTTWHGVFIWEYNRLYKAGKSQVVGSFVSTGKSPTLDKPEVWTRIDVAVYNGGTYLVKYYPSFYGPYNVACYKQN